MFGVPVEKVKGCSISTLMPEFMASEHENILNNWVQSSSWRSIGKLKEIFCVHRDQYCFSALLYIKIYQKEGSLYFITNIFKTNQDNYLILDPINTISVFGKKFTKIIG